MFRGVVNVDYTGLLNEIISVAVVYVATLQSIQCLDHRRQVLILQIQ